MLFNSFVFMLFLLVVWVVYRSIPHRPQICFLIVCSYFFYGYWDWRFCSLLLISTVVDFTCGQGIAKSENPKFRKRLLLTSIIVNLGLLATFKYFNFFTETFADLCGRFGYNPGFVTLNVVLPLGISFYTLQTMCYTIDVYRGKIPPTRDFPAFMLYVSYFPQLVAGPIERAGNLLPQLEKPRTITSAQIAGGINLIVVGMFKKIVISDSTLAPFVDNVYRNPYAFDSLELVQAAVFFAIQIYCDFSGYSDIARGTSKLFGVELIENFQQPFLATSFAEFWSRWHVSLTRWLVDYVYIPLGGSRGAPWKIYRNIMILMSLCGLWHGATRNYVLWGVFSGVILCIERLLYGPAGAPKKRTVSNVREFFVFTGFLLLTQFGFVITVLFVRSSSFTLAIDYIRMMFVWHGPIYDGTIWLQLVFMIGVLLMIDLPMYFWRDHTFMLRFSRPIRYAVYTVAMTLVVFSLLHVREQPFFYFQF